VKSFVLKGLLELRSSRAYLELIREESMSGGLYALPVDGEDEQSPHTEDEVYVVVAGRSQFTAGSDTHAVEPGDVMFVAAGVPHHFHDITEELRLIVVFAPAEGSRAAG
jgi:mannose-6-phosphate isomerase-like protein (cupin superfamily)